MAVDRSTSASAGTDDLVRPTGLVLKRTRTRWKRSVLVTSEGQDVALAPGSAQLAWSVALCVAAVVFAFAGPPELVRASILAAIYAIAALGLTVLSGTAAVVSLGHAAFFGVGAFCTGYLSGDRSYNFFIAMVIAAVLCALLGALVAPIAARLSGIYMAIVTVGLVFLAQHVFRSWTSVTGGTSGRIVDGPTVFGFEFMSNSDLLGVHLRREVKYFLLVGVVVVIVGILTANLLRSRTGRALDWTATSPHTSGVLGISTARYRTIAFCYSSALAGVAGGLFAGWTGFIGYEQFDMYMSVVFLAIIVVGGLGKVSGALIGAVFVFGLPELIDALGPYTGLVAEQGSTAGLTGKQVTAVLFGIGIAAVMVLEPQGLVGLGRRLKAYFGSWPF